MKQVLNFEFECGEKTCAESPGKFCKFMTYNSRSGKSICYFFGQLYDENGWVQRAEKCIEMSKNKLGD